MTKAILKKLILASMDYLKDKAVGQGIRFDIPGTDNEGFLRLDKGYSPDTPVVLITAAAPKGDDHAVQHFYHYASNLEEMQAWLRNVNNAEGILASLKELSARASEGFD